MFERSRGHCTARLRDVKLTDVESTALLKGVGACTNWGYSKFDR